MLSKKVQRRRKVKFGIRKKIKGTPECPRLSVFRSNKAIYAQLIDDISAKTMASSSSKGKTGSKIDLAKEVGTTVAAAAKSIGIEKVVFDRGGYLYHGRIKALAEGAREGGLKF